MEEKAKFSFSVYIDALQSVMAKLPMPEGQELQLLIKRVCGGLKNQNT